MYTIDLNFKSIQMYTIIIDLHLKAKSLVYILRLKYKKWAFFISFEITSIFKN